MADASATLFAAVRQGTLAEVQQGLNVKKLDVRRCAAEARSRAGLVQPAAGWACLTACCLQAEQGGPDGAAHGGTASQAPGAASQQRSARRPWSRAQVWRSRLAVIDLLLQAGAPTDVQDAESGWCGPGCAPAASPPCRARRWLSSSVDGP